MVSPEGKIERPVIVEGNRFEDYLGVSKWLLRRVSDSHTVSRLTVPQVVGVLIGERDDCSTQRLRLTSNKAMGEVVRHYSGMPVGGGVGVSGYPGETVNVITHPEPWGSELLDRGLAWVRVGIEIPSVFHVTVRSEHAVDSAEELARRLTAAEQCSMELIESVLRSEANPPYAIIDEVR